MALAFLFCRTFYNRVFCFKKVKKRVFHTFGMKDILIKRLKDINISKPTAIQKKVSRMEPARVPAKSKKYLAHLSSNCLAHVFIIEFGWRQGSIPSKICFSPYDEIRDL